MFRASSLSSSVGPSFQWNLLNYGRIANNVRLQDAAFQELVAAYQQSVLQASREVEDGLVTFLRAQRQRVLLDESVTAASNAVKIVVLQYKVGTVDFNRYAVIEQNLVTQQDQLAQSRGQIAQGLIQTYRALGGGWEIRLGADGAAGATQQAAPYAPTTPENVPAPLPDDSNSNTIPAPLPPQPYPPLPRAPSPELPPPSMEPLPKADMP